MLYIFDWDGTLLDSTAKIVGAMQVAIAELGLPAVDALHIKGIIGLGLPEAVRQLYPSEQNGVLEQLAAAYSRHFVLADQVPCQFYPGVRRGLFQLRADGHQLAVATGKSRRGLNRVLTNVGLEGFFDTSRCADETASKPDPMMLRQILDELSVDPAEAVMVGDTEFDLNMANNAGMRSIGVSYGAHDRSRLDQCRPLHIVESFDELLRWSE